MPDTDLRALDARIAVELFGWTDVECQAEYRLLGDCTGRPRGLTGRDYVPLYSSVPSCLQAVKAELKRIGMRWLVLCRYDGEHLGRVWPKPTKDDPNPADFCKGAPDEAPALCRAVLAALGPEVAG